MIGLEELTVEDLYADLDLPAGDAAWLQAIESIPVWWQWHPTAKDMEALRE